MRDASDGAAFFGAVLPGVPVPAAPAADAALLADAGGSTVQNQTGRLVRSLPDKSTLPLPASSADGAVCAFAQAAPAGDAGWVGAAADAVSASAPERGEAFCEAVQLLLRIPSGLYATGHQKAEDRSAFSDGQPFRPR